MRAGHLRGNGDTTNSDGRFDKGLDESKGLEQGEK